MASGVFSLFLRARCAFDVARRAHEMSLKLNINLKFLIWTQVLVAALIASVLKVDAH
jgi:hypothetical protein